MKKNFISGLAQKLGSFLLLCGIMLGIPSCLGPMEEPLTIEEFKHFQEKERSTELLPQGAQGGALRAIECEKEQERRKNWSTAEHLLDDSKSACDPPDGPKEPAHEMDRRKEIETIVDRQLKEALEKAE